MDVVDTILVTGGAGFIGANFVRLALARTRARVVVVDKLTYAGNRASLLDVSGDLRFAFVQADIAERAAVEALFREHRPRWVVNLAAETHVDRSIDGPRAFLATNVAGTFELLEAARGFLGEADAPTRAAFRFLHVSTDEVYGSLGPTGLFTETTAYAPNSPYAASKAAADHFVRAYHETFGVFTLTTNCTNNYGPYQYPEKLIPLLILNALDGRPLPIYGDGGNVRDWLYVDDHCEAILMALERGRSGEKYNVGALNERTNLEIVDRICTALEVERPAASNPALRARGIARYADLKTFVTDRPGHDRRYALDASRTRRELGWAPRHDFEDGLRHTVRWYLEHRDWCDTVQAGRYERQRLGLGDRGPEQRPVGPTNRAGSLAQKAVDPS
jgi:dTDP-glucose 4,6-dehydratase